MNATSQPLPAHSRSKAIAFTALSAVTALVSLVCAVLNYAILTKGSILSDFYDQLASTDLEFYVWTAAGIAALSAIATLVSYILSFDFRRPARPYWRLYFLLAAFSIFLASYVLGYFEVTPDSVGPIVGALLACLILPIPVLLIERATGKGSIKSARRFLDSGSPAAARAAARTGLLFKSGDNEALACYGLALAETGKLDAALPYLLHAEAQGTVDNRMRLALANAWETAGDKRKTTAYLEEVYQSAPTTDLSHRLVVLWLELGDEDKALDAIEAFDTGERRRWRPDWLRLLQNRRDHSGLREACADIRSTDAEPFDDTRSCMELILTLFPRDTETLRSLIQLHRNAKRAEETARLEEHLLTLKDDADDVRRLLIEYYWGKGKRPDMLRHLNRLLIRGVATPDEKLRILEETYSEGDYMRVEQLVEAEPDLATNARAVATLAHAMYDGGRHDEALERITQARRMEPDSTLTKHLDILAAKIKNLVLGQELKALGDRAQHEPENMDLKFDLLDRYVAAGSADRAVMEMDDLIGSHPEIQPRVEQEIRVMLTRHGRNPRLMDYLADLYLRAHAFDKAYELFERRSNGEMDREDLLHDGAQRILAINPSHAPSLLSEVHYHAGRNEPARALESLDKLQASGGEVSPALREIELQLATQTGQNERAEVAGAALLSESTGNTSLLVKMATLAAQTGKFDLALERLKNAQELDPDSFEIRRQIRSTAEAKKRARLAEVQEQLKREPGNRALYVEMGDYLYDFERLNESLAAYQRAALNDPTQRVARTKLGYVLTKKGLLAEAEEAFAEAGLKSDLAEDEQEIMKALFFQSAQLMEEHADNERALNLYRQVFRVDAGYQGVVEHVERLQVTSKKRKPV